MMWMPWRRRSRTAVAAARMRAEHERFLTLALLAANRYPRIPTKPVSSGGFQRVTAAAPGRARAERWWSLALERVD